MLSYIYQVQKLSRGSWKPVFWPLSSSNPLESNDLDFIMDKARFISSNYEDIRVVKIEIYLIENLS